MGSLHLANGKPFYLNHSQWSGYYEQVRFMHLAHRCIQVDCGHWSLILQPFDIHTTISWKTSLDHPGIPVCVSQWHWLHCLQSSGQSKWPACLLCSCQMRVKSLAKTYSNLRKVLCYFLTSSLSPFPIKYSFDWSWILALFGADCGWSLTEIPLNADWSYH